ncbi:hypothetical protein ABT354_19880 [Streptomyces sp. NPDC000594]|uniref:hypothetical protein n=1 Tax=Streptomyces sp. NPDC000594 TaxID=3154261 RepID=UPI003327DE27
MTSRTNEAALERRQRLRDKHKRQLGAVNQLERLEKKRGSIEDDRDKQIAKIEEDAARDIAAVEEEIAGAVRDAVDAFGGQQVASENLGLTLREIRRYLAEGDEQEPDSEGEEVRAADEQGPAVSKEAAPAGSPVDADGVQSDAGSGTPEGVSAT